jgi:hypothetical protein
MSLFVLKIKYCIFVKNKIRMKQIILFILVLAQMSFAVAQSLVVTGDTAFTGNLVTQIAHHLDIENTSANPISIVCEKTNVTLPTGAETYYCFAGECYATTTTTSDTTSFPLAAGQKISFADSDFDAHSGYYDAYGASGIAEVQYCFYDANNSSDQTCLTITYDCVAAPPSWDCDSIQGCYDPQTGLGDYSAAADCQAACIIAINEEISNLTEISDFYPNPANGLTHFTFNGIKAQLKIIDILGNEVKIIQLEEPGIKNIDLTDMSKGIYFGKLVVNNKVNTIKKLIVN